MTPEVTESLKFLESWIPGGPWVLTSISTDKKSLKTRTFTSSSEASEFIKEEGELQKNIYFTVNPISKAVSSKPSRSDVEAMAWLHVDVDPREGEDLQEEQERIEKILRDPPDNIPPPTIIVFSGGGLQGFWKLEEPVLIQGQEALFEDAKHYNLQLEMAFGADSCHNVDRIMRLPGTINWPDAKKAKKGRVPALARVVSYHADRVYPIDQFQKAR